jgi:hypothetical protein
VWSSSGQDGSGTGVFGRRYDSTGAAFGTEFQVNTYTSMAQIPRAVAGAADGGFMVVWSSNGQDGNYNGVFGQRLDSTGAASGTEFQVNTYTTSGQTPQSIARTDDGGFVVVWRGYGQGDTDELGVFGQRLDSAGAALGTEFRVNTYTTDAQVEASVAAIAGGGFVVVWQSEGPDGDSYGVFGQRFGSTGAAAGSEFQINTFTTQEQSYPRVARTVDDDFVVVWHSLGQDGSGYGIFGRRLDSSGAAVGTEFQLNTSTPNDQQVPEVGPAVNGGFVVTWDSYTQDGSNYGVFGRVFATAPSPSPLGDCNCNGGLDAGDPICVVLRLIGALSPDPCCTLFCSE